MSEYAQQLGWLRAPIQETSVHPNIILDSGAYSVWRSGAEVDYKKYDSYCRVVKDVTLTCVNLDQIPGAWGKHVTAEQVEEACAVSYARWKDLRASGALIMPVYHQGDDLKWLRRYLDEGALYIGISPTDSYSAPIRQQWLHEVHRCIEDAGFKLNKQVFTHCLGVFAPRILYDLPTWSADASTISRWTAWKRVLIPKIERKKITGFRFVSVSTTRPPREERVDWSEIANYLRDVAVEGSEIKAWCRDKDNPPDKPLIAHNSFEISQVNLSVAIRTMRDTGVRCFIAGSDRPFKYAIEVRERYPYILTSYATIKETTGDIIKRIYNRATPKPVRRPDRDRKVEATGGLFS